jgi:hypothetical protein
MFGRKRKVELSEGSKQSIIGLREDITTLAELVHGVLDNSLRLMESLETLATNGDEESDDPDQPCGVVAFDDGEVMEKKPPVEEKKREKEPPPGMAVNKAPVTEERVRDSPFTRAPRTKQVTWLRREVLCDGKWHTPQEIANEYANDERHLRYLKHAVGGRLREMHEDRIVERRKSNVRGSMFEYRLPPK